MNPSLQKICEDFIVNRDAVQKAFKWDLSYVYPVCANIFCARGRIVNPEQLKESRKVIDENTGLLSNFRGNIRPILAAMLALSSDPASQMEQAKENYALLKKEFRGTEYLAMAAFLLTNMASRTQVEEKTARGKEIYQRMKKEHPFLTGGEDSVFAVLMAFSEKTDDELISDMEACYQALKARFHIGNEVQTVSHVLAMTDGESEKKAQRVIDLYKAVRDAGVKYGKNHELATLAALSLTETDIPTLVEEIREADAFLMTQKGYGVLGLGAQQRAMNAAMIVSDQYTSREQVRTASMTSTLALVIATEMAMCAIAASVSAMATSSH